MTTKIEEEVILMTVKYNVTGTKRKELVQLISHFTGCEAKYKGAPSFAYEVDYFTIDRDGALSFDDRADSEVIERLLEMLYDNGFEAEALPEADEEKPEEDSTEVEITGLAIQIPMADFTETSLKNVFALVEAKGNLIKKALEVDELPINLIDDSLDFPWFKAESTPEEVKAYMDFVTALCNFAKNQTRVTATARDVENEKYAFRCFLLRLGFIGEEYKQTRKILLRNMEGSSAFKKSKAGEANA